MAARPRVSVVVPTRDRPQLLAKALDSVRRLDGPDLDLEIIVVDSGSTAGACECAEAVGAVYLRREGAGASEARNAGLRAATGEVLAFLDDDDVYLPGNLRPQLQRLRDDPWLMAVFGQTVNSDEGLVGRGDPWPAPLPTRGFAGVFSYCPQLGATVVRASALQTVGYFDTSLVGDEDWEWQLRIALRHPVDFVAVPCVLYRVRRPGNARGDDLEWTRLRFFDRVMWWATRAAGDQRPPLRSIARRWLRGRGAYTDYFLKSAAVHARNGDAVLARRQRLRALAASPLHTLSHLVGRLRPAAAPNPTT